MSPLPKACKPSFVRHNQRCEISFYLKFHQILLYSFTLTDAMVAYPAPRPDLTFKWIKEGLMF